MQRLLPTHSRLRRPCSSTFSFSTPPSLHLKPRSYRRQAVTPPQPTPQAHRAALENCRANVTHVVHDASQASPVGSFLGTGWFSYAFCYALLTSLINIWVSSPFIERKPSFKLSDSNDECTRECEQPSPPTRTKLKSAARVKRGVIILDDETEKSEPPAAADASQSRVESQSESCHIRYQCRERATGNGGHQ